MKAFRALWLRAFAALLFVCFLLNASLAAANETQAYSYDVLGRLVKVVRTGTVNAGASECYAYDKASNRSNVTVNTSADCSGGGGGTSVSFSINDVAVTEGGNLVFTVTKSGTASASTSLSYAIAANTATAASDFDYSAQAQTGTLTFATATTTQTVTVHTIDDTLVESAETLFVNLSNASTGTTISDSQGAGTINDNDSGGGGGSTCSGISFSVNDASNTEGSPVLFTITKTGTTSSSCTVNYATADGTAVGGTGADYTLASGTLTFASTVTSLPVSVTTRQDLNVEPDDTFYLNLSLPSGGAAITDAQGLGTIINDDDPNPCPLC